MHKRKHPLPQHTVARLRRRGQPVTLGDIQRAAEIAQGFNPYLIEEGRRFGDLYEVVDGQVRFIELA